MFTTPSSTVSGLLGGAGRGDLSCVCLILVEKLDNVCGGVITRSGSKRFCCKSNCEAKSHKKTKLRFTPNSLYVRGIRSGQARVEPCIQIHELPDDVNLVELLKESKSLDV